MIRVLLADGQSLVCNGFRMLIDSADGMETIGEVSNGADAMMVVKLQPVDVVLMDIRMLIMDGTEAIRQIMELGGETKVLVLAALDLSEYVFAALRNGASGFLLKDALPGDLLGAIRAVAGDGTVMTPTATRHLLDHITPKLPAGKPRDNSRLNGLTEREREVPMEMARGANDTEIGSHLYMVEDTVKTHIGRLLTKLRARGHVKLVLIAHECRLLD